MGNHLETNGKDDPSPGATPCGRMLVFRVDGRRYAAPVDAVLSVGAAGGEAGTVLFRGSAVAVADAGDLGLGDPRGARGSRGTVVVVDGGPGEARALRVDAVEGIVEGLEMREWPAMLAPLPGPGFPGLAPGRDEALVVVDPRALLRDSEPGEARRPQEEAGEKS